MQTERYVPHWSMGGLGSYQLARRRLPLDAQTDVLRYLETKTPEHLLVSGQLDPAMVWLAKVRNRAREWWVGGGRKA